MIAEAPVRFGGLETRCGAELGEPRPGRPGVLCQQLGCPPVDLWLALEVTLLQWVTDLGDVLPHLPPPMGGQSGDPVRIIPRIGSRLLGLSVP